MLTAQAQTLDAIYANLALRSAMNLGEYLNAAVTYMRLALEAPASPTDQRAYTFPWSACWSVRIKFGSIVITLDNLEAKDADSNPTRMPR
jgi:hypothetical protein